MEWIYLSPHLDDIALSCGGLVWEQANSGDHPSIWTLCAGDPPEGELSPFAESLHRRWNTGREAVAIRRFEDEQACARLSAAYHHFSIPDCIYRKSFLDGCHLYTSEEAIFGMLDPVEQPLLEKISNEIGQLAPVDAALVCPLTIGGHVDHRLVRAAAELLGRPLWYYADYPYVEQFVEQIPALMPDGCKKVLWTVSGVGMRAWFDAAAAHRSQIGTFWQDITTMKTALQHYSQENGGIPLWRRSSRRSDPDA
jgi:LmbE family N-acetylglucosaminyl deacetylase